MEGWACQPPPRSRYPRATHLKLSWLFAIPMRAVAQQPDSMAIQLSWDGLAFLVRSDTAEGEELWVSAHVLKREEGQELHWFRGTYDPRAVAPPGSRMSSRCCCRTARAPPTRPSSSRCGHSWTWTAAGSSGSSARSP